MVALNVNKDIMERIAKINALVHALNVKKIRVALNVNKDIMEIIVLKLVLIAYLPVKQKIVLKPQETALIVKNIILDLDVLQNAQVTVLIRNAIKKGNVIVALIEKWEIFAMRIVK